MEDKKLLLKINNVNLQIDENKIIKCSGNLGTILRKFGGEDILFGKDKVLLKSKSSYKVFVSLLKMMSKGVTDGYFKELDFVGLGYRFINLKRGIFLKIGYSHYIKLNIPTNIKVIGFKNKLIVFGLDLESVNLVASQIKLLRKPDKYKGKGIRYEGEEIELKVGKQR